MFLIFNFVGLLMLCAGFGLPIAIGSVLKVGSENSFQIAAGILLVAMDLAWRRFRNAELDLEDVIVDSKRGGHLFFLPIWICGILWLVLGVYQRAVA